MLTTLGHVIAIGAVGVITAWAFISLACEVIGDWQESRQVRMSDTLDSPVFFTEADLIAAEDERMETLRLQLDELWEDDECPRDSFADAALDYYDWVVALPERRAV